MKLEPMNPQPPVTSTFTMDRRECQAGNRKTENGKRGRASSVSRFSFPVLRLRSYDPDLRVVSDQETVHAGALRAGMDPHVGAYQGVGDAAGNALDAGALEHDGVLDLA